MCDFLVEPSTELEEYQQFVAHTTSNNINVDIDLPWSVLGLASEAGECTAVLEKAWRKKGYIDATDEEKLLDELGDVLWYLAAVANALEVPLDEVMQHNIDKLNQRNYDLAKVA